MCSSLALRLVLTGHGAPAREALWELIGAVRGGDPLAPVTVAVPSTYAGLSLRRDLGRRPGGLVNVRFLSLNRVAELLGAPFLAAPPGNAGRVPLTATHRAGAIRVALDATDGPFRPLAAHPATTRAFAATLAELDGLTDAELTRLAAAGPREAAVVAVARRVRALVAGTYTDEDQLRAAAAMVAAGGVGLDDLGAVILFAPPSLTPGGLDLVLALAHAGAAAARARVHGRRRRRCADRASSRRGLTAALGRRGAARRRSRCPAGDRSAQLRRRRRRSRASSSANVLRRLEAGEPLHRMAVTYRNAVPYARLLHEHLARPASRCTGRARPRCARRSRAGAARVAAAVRRRVPPRRRRRAARHRTDPRAAGRRGRCPGPLWDRISCLANVVGGLDQWHGRLERYREDREAELARRATEAGTFFADVVDRSGEAARRLDAFVADLAVGGAAIAGQPASWTALATWAVGLLDRYLAPRAADDAAVAATASSTRSTAVRERIGALAQLDDLGAPVSTVAFLRAVDDELDVSVGYGGKFGDGVLVAPLSALRGTAFDTVFVLGLVEGAFPPPVRDDPLLSDRARSTVGAPHPPQRHRGAASAPTTSPRSRRRRARAHHATRRPARATHRRGPRRGCSRRRRASPAGPCSRPSSTPGIATAQDAPWLELVASFESALEHAPHGRLAAGAPPPRPPGLEGGPPPARAGTRSRWPGPTCGSASPRSAPVAGATSARGTA